MYICLYLPFSFIKYKRSFNKLFSYNCFHLISNNIQNIHTKEHCVEETSVHLVISSCSAIYWHKSLYRFHSSAGTTSCPDRGSSLESHNSTLSTGPPCICRSEQLGRKRWEGSESMCCIGI